MIHAKTTPNDMETDKNKPCGHGCYRLREYTCTACANEEKAELLKEIEKIKEDKSKVITAFINYLKFLTQILRWSGIR